MVVVVVVVVIGRGVVVVGFPAGGGLLAARGRGGSPCRLRMFCAGFFGPPLTSLSRTNSWSCFVAGIGCLQAYND